jgi:signal transduction histidine kinase
VGVDANKLVAGVAELLRRTVGEAVSLETDLAGEAWTAFVDSNQLENALLNLALNARDAMPDGGKLTIETANCDFDDKSATNGGSGITAGQYVMLAVTNTGLGMDRTTLDKARANRSSRRKASARGRVSVSARVTGSSSNRSAT